MKLLVRNLLKNALAYGGEPNVDVSLFIDAQQIILRVEDHGEGISVEHLENVTEPFYRVDPSRHRSSGGIGLGLYLCKRIAEAHGGHLTLRSVVGQGTTIDFTLPL